MRTLVIAMFMAAGIGLAGTSTASATPPNQSVIRDAVRAQSHVEQAYCRWVRRCWHGPYSGRRCEGVRRCWW
jgi:hypothetical protein